METWSACGPAPAAKTHPKLTAGQSSMMMVIDRTINDRRGLYLALDLEWMVVNQHEPQRVE